MVKFLILTVIIMLSLLGCQSYDTSINHSYATANIKLALALLDHGYVKEAKQKLIIAQQVDYPNAAVWYVTGYYNETVGEMMLAKKNYLYALMIDPKNGAAHNNYGAFLCRMGQYKESLEQFELALKDPYYLDVAATFENAGICALKISDKMLAQNYFKKALDHDPNLLRVKIHLNTK